MLYTCVTQRVPVLNEHMSYLHTEPNISKIQAEAKKRTTMLMIYELIVMIRIHKQESHSNEMTKYVDIYDNDDEDTYIQHKMATHVIPGPETGDTKEIGFPTLAERNEKE